MCKIFHTYHFHPFPLFVPILWLGSHWDLHLSSSSLSLGPKNVALKVNATKRKIKKESHNEKGKDKIPNVVEEGVTDASMIACPLHLYTQNVGPPLIGHIVIAPCLEVIPTTQTYCFTDTYVLRG